MMVLEFHIYLPYDSFTSGCYSFPVWENYVQEKFILQIWKLYKKKAQVNKT